MKIKKLAILSILTIILLSGCNKKDDNISDSIVQPQETSQQQAAQEQQLPTFHLTTSMGKNITIEVTKKGWVFKEYPNKAVLLVFFATWCPPCKAEIPHLINLQNKYKDSLEVIAVLVEQNKDNMALNDFIKDHNIIYPVTNSPENFNLASAVGGVDSIPAMFVFNPDGYVVQRYQGAVHEEILENDIKQALGK